MEFSSTSSEKLWILLLLDVDYFFISICLGGVSAVRQHVHNSQPFIFFPGPPNFCLSLQKTQVPQSNCEHLSHFPHCLLFIPGTTASLHVLCVYIRTITLLDLGLLEYGIKVVPVCFFCNIKSKYYFSYKCSQYPSLLCLRKW